MELEGGDQRAQARSQEDGRLTWVSCRSWHRVGKPHSLLAQELEKPKDGLRGESAAHLPPAREGSQQRRGISWELQPHWAPALTLQVSEQSRYLMLLVVVSR